MDRYSHIFVLVLLVYIGVGSIEGIHYMVMFVWLCSSPLGFALMCLSFLR